MKHKQTQVRRCSTLNAHMYRPSVTRGQIQRGGGLMSLQKMVDIALDISSKFHVAETRSMVTIRFWKSAATKRREKESAQ